jgi:anti-sigma factor RsiW
MNCDQVKPLLGAYHDGEISDVVRIQEIEQHLATCEECAREMQALQAASSAIREKANYFKPRAELVIRIKEETGFRTWQDEVKNTRVKFRWFNPFSVAGLTGAAMVLIFMVLILRAGQAGFEGELVAGHYRSLQAKHLLDVPSSDQHTVKPWFQGKLDFSPKVPDLSDQGFVLLGGRLDIIRRRPAAALVYGRKKHIINVFVMHPVLGQAKTANVDGFNIIEWTSDHLAYCAVSDVNQADLQAFATAFQANSGAPR